MGGRWQSASPNTSDWEISVDLYREKRREARKKGRMDKKRREIEKGKVEN